jgi:hypothetical protein
MLDRYQPVARKTAFTLRNALTLPELITEDQLGRSSQQGATVCSTLCKKHKPHNRRSAYGFLAPVLGLVPFTVSVLPCGVGQFGWQPPSVLGRRGGLVVVVSGFLFGGGAVAPGGFAPGPTPPTACA